MLCPVNITFLQKVLHKGIINTIKILFLRKKIRNNWYVEKDIFERVEKCPLNIAFILIFYLQNGNTISKKII